MAIDYSIDFDCEPKQTFTTNGIMERLKGEERAQTIIALFRKNGDDRPPSKMGFEFTRSTPDGQEETRVIVVQELLDQAEQLKPYAHHCEGCPANVLKRPFGCIGHVGYPISTQAETWLLDQLPVPDEPLIWLLLRQGVDEFEYDGSSIAPLRQAANENGEGVYFEDQRLQYRKLGEFNIDANQVFEMFFAVGSYVLPNHAALLLLFTHAIPRNIEADEIIHIKDAPKHSNLAEKYPFNITIKDEDDQSTAEFKQMLHAMYVAWKLSVRFMVDA